MLSAPANTVGSPTNSVGRATNSSQNGLGLMLFALFRKSHFQLRCGTGKRNWEVLPEWSGSNAFCTIWGNALSIWKRCILLDWNWKVLPEWSGSNAFCTISKRHFRLHCGTGKRNSEVLPEWSGSNVFCIVPEKSLSAALQN